MNYREMCHHKRFPHKNTESLFLKDEYLLVAASKSDAQNGMHPRRIPRKDDRVERPRVRAIDAHTCARERSTLFSSLSFIFSLFLRKRVVFIFRPQYCAYLIQRDYIYKTHEILVRLFRSSAPCLFASPPSPSFLSSLFLLFSLSTVASFPRIYNVVAHDAPSGVILSFSQSRTSKKLPLRCDRLRSLPVRR